MILYILYQYFQKKYNYSDNLSILKNTIMYGGVIYFIVVYFNIFALLGIYVMNMDILSIIYCTSITKEKIEPIFIQNSTKLYKNIKKPSIIFKQKPIDLTQTFHHTIENIGIS